MEALLKSKSRQYNAKIIIIASLGLEAIVNNVNY